MESRRPEWEVRAYGDQRNDADVDLMAQIVVILGRELIKETKMNESQHHDSLFRQEEA